MKIDTTLLATDLSQVPTLTQAAEAMGFDGIWTSETAHDAFLPLVLAAEHSNRISLGTSIAVAFPRSPAILAHIVEVPEQYTHCLGFGSKLQREVQNWVGSTGQQPLSIMRRP